MPKYPHLAKRVGLLPASVYEKFRDSIRQNPGLVKLHIGDTYLRPAYEFPLNRRFCEIFPDFSKYCNTYGIDELRLKLADKVTSDNHISASRDHILVTSGTTNGLSAAMMSLIEEGEEVIVLTPCWPFFPGMVKIAGGKVVEVPLYMDLYSNSNLDLKQIIDAAATERTVAIYVNSPNNPSGKVLSRDQLRVITNLAKDRDWWLISDEAYDGLTFDDREHVSPASFEGMADRTLTMFTFSKIFMFAALRLGYVVGPANMIHAINKVMVHQLYSPSTFGQQMMIAPLQNRHEWMSKVNNHYQELRNKACDALKISHDRPEGTYFIFFDAAPYLNGRSFDDLMVELIQSGVLVAPGGDFGKSFEKYIRLCFTGEEPDRLEEGIHKFNSVLLK